MPNPIPHSIYVDKAYWLRRWRSELEVETTRLERLRENLRKKEMMVRRLEEKIKLLEDHEATPSMTPAQRAAQVNALIAAAQQK